MGTECKEDFLKDKNKDTNVSGNDTENVENTNRECDMLTKDCEENFEKNEQKSICVNECEDSTVNKNDHLNTGNSEEMICRGNSIDYGESKSNENNKEVNNFPKQTKSVKEEISLEGKWAIRTYSGYVVTITVHPDKDRPINFESTEAEEMWNMATEINLSRLKCQVQNGEYIPDDAVVEVDPNPITRPDSDDIKTEEERRDNVVNRENKKVKCLENEYNLVKLCLQIQDFFSHEHRVKEGLSVMNEVLQLNITSLMLKKNPFIVNIIYCLSHYEGASEQLDMSNASCNNDVRVKALEIYHKFQSLFVIPKNRTFEEYFREQYKLLWKMLGNDERRICELINDPTDGML